MIVKKHSTLVLTGTILGGLGSAIALAADVEPLALPAISAPNGKIEIMGGLVDSDVNGSDELFYAGGALSMPLGEDFGLQLDATAVDAYRDTAFGVAGHLFTRDPSSFLFGAIGGAADFAGGDMLWGGGESELYLGNISIETIAGIMDLDVGTGSDTEFFGESTLVLYPTEDLRLSAGVSSIAGFQSANAGLEWMISGMDMPVALKATVIAGEEDFISAKIGLSFYFGGNESGKSLMRRHREDDPRIRSFISETGATVIGSGVLGSPETCAAMSVEEFWEMYEGNWEAISSDPCYIELYGDV